jgi:hypothetical protein
MQQLIMVYVVTHLNEGVQAYNRQQVSMEFQDAPETLQ